MRRSLSPEQIMTKSSNLEGSGVDGSEHFDQKGYNEER